MDGDRIPEAQARIEQLSKLDFKIPSPEQISQPGGGLPVREFQKDSIVFLENEMDTKFYIIEEGSVAVKKFTGKDEILLAVLKKGSFLGEMAMMDKAPRSASAYTIEKSTLTMVTEDRFGLMLNNSALSSILQRFMETICERIYITSRQVFDFIQTDISDRMFATLSTELIRARATDIKIFSFKFGLDKLLEFVDLEDSYEMVRDIFTNNRLFSIDELISEIGTSKVNYNHSDYSCEKIFMVYNGMLTCLNTKRLLDVREKLLYEVNNKG